MIKGEVGRFAVGACGALRDGVAMDSCAGVAACIDVEGIVQGDGILFAEARRVALPTVGVAPKTYFT